MRAQGVSTSQIKLTYRCGNYFRIRNLNNADVAVGYSVYRTSESGTMTLPAAISGIGYSETWLHTINKGAVRLTYGATRVAEKPNGGAACSSLFSQGQWTDTIPWPFLSIHVHLLPNGKVLSFGREFADINDGFTLPPGKTNGYPTVWDPVANTFTRVDQGSDLFCSGHTFMADGRLIEVGGNFKNSGQRYSNTFDYRTNSWKQNASMAFDRWYATATALSTAEVLVIGGTDSGASPGTVITPEVFDPASGTFRQLTNAQRSLGWYPWMFVTPNATNGTVFFAGNTPGSYFMTTAGSGSLGQTFVTFYGVTRDYGSAVMYDVGKIIIMGGGNTYATAELVDLNQANPSWRATASMHSARRQMNAVILANGQVMASGGSAGAGFNPPTNLATIPEIWDPATEVWTQVADAKVPRVYHSETLLLPDATVISLGSGQPAASGLSDQFNYQIYTPPYLYNPDGTQALASRPVITSAPASTGYGQNFTVKVQGAAAASVLWIRMGSVTHAFNQSQRLNHLVTSQSGGTLTVTAPANSRLAPAGHYLLFVINANGVPSKGTIIQIQ